MKSCFVGKNTTFVQCQYQNTYLSYLSTNTFIIIIIYFTMFRDNYDDCTSTSFITLCVNLSHLLVCFNSSANFVIYLMGGEKFRRVWCETYLCKKHLAYSSNGIQRYVHINIYIYIYLNNIKSRGVF